MSFIRGVQVLFSGVEAHSTDGEQELESKVVVLVVEIKLLIAC